LLFHDLIADLPLCFAGLHRLRRVLRKTGQTDEVIAGGLNIDAPETADLDRIVRTLRLLSNDTALGRMPVANGQQHRVLRLVANGKTARTLWCQNRRLQDTVRLFGKDP